jgi:hypothetical protein
MKTWSRARILLGCLLAVTMLLSNSCIYIGHLGEMDRFEREVSLSAPLSSGSSFAAQTGDGSITVAGRATDECNVLARIETRARTQEQAEELAQQIDVRLEPTDNGLKVVIDRPPVIRNAGFSVSLDVNLPTQTDLALAASDGRVRIRNITGNVNARTSDGSIETNDIHGDVTLKTSDGSISCGRVDANTADLHTSDGGIKISEATLGRCTARTSDGGITIKTIRGDQVELHTSDGSIRCQNINVSRLDCHTSDGGIQIEFAPEAPKDVNVSATTSDGSITLTVPPELSAMIEAHADDGSIRTDLPITIQGKIDKSLQGTIGDGQGRIYLKTHDGSITIR